MFVLLLLLLLLPDVNAAVMLIANAGWHQLKQPHCYLVIAGPSVIILIDNYSSF